MKASRGSDEKVGPSDLAVMMLARFTSKLLPVVIVGTIVVICVAVYAIAWYIQKP